MTLYTCNLKGSPYDQSSNLYLELSNETFFVCNVKKNVCVRLSGSLIELHLGVWRRRRLPLTRGDTLIRISFSSSDTPPDDINTHSGIAHRQTHELHRLQKMNDVAMSPAGCLGAVQSEPCCIKLN